MNEALSLQENQQQPENMSIRRKEKRNNAEGTDAERKLKEEEGRQREDSVLYVQHRNVQKFKSGLFGVMQCTFKVQSLSHASCQSLEASGGNGMNQRELSHCGQRVPRTYIRTLISRSHCSLQTHARVKHQTGLYMHT